MFFILFKVSFTKYEGRVGTYLEAINLKNNISMIPMQPNNTMFSKIILPSGIHLLQEYLKTAHIATKPPDKANSTINAPIMGREFSDLVAASGLS